MIEEFNAKMLRNLATPLIEKKLEEEKVQRQKGWEELKDFLTEKAKEGRLMYFKPVSSEYNKVFGHTINELQRKCNEVGIILDKEYDDSQPSSFPTPDRKLKGIRFNWNGK